MDFIREERISGVVFLTGDRHHSEVIGKKIGDSYTLFDITSSSLTAGAHKVTGLEINNPDRIPGTLVEANNYTRFHISGAAKDRLLEVEFMSPKGEKLGSFSLHENQIKWA